jgi:hypothetical protein
LRQGQPGTLRTTTAAALILRSNFPAQAGRSVTLDVTGKEAASSHHLKPTAFSASSAAATAATSPACCRPPPPTASTRPPPPRPFCRRCPPTAARTPAADPPGPVAPPSGRPSPPRRPGAAPPRPPRPQHLPRPPACQQSFRMTCGRCRRRGRRGGGPGRRSRRSACRRPRAGPSAPAGLVFGGGEWGAANRIKLKRIKLTATASDHRRTSDSFFRASSSSSPKASAAVRFCAARCMNFMPWRRSESCAPPPSRASPGCCCEEVPAAGCCCWLSSEAPAAFWRPRCMNGRLSSALLSLAGRSLCSLGGAMPKGMPGGCRLGGFRGKAAGSGSGGGGGGAASRRWNAGQREFGCTLVSQGYAVCNGSSAALLGLAGAAGELNDGESSVLRELDDIDSQGVDKWVSMFQSNFVLLHVPSRRLLRPRGRSQPNATPRTAAAAQRLPAVNSSHPPPPLIPSCQLLNAAPINPTSTT